MGERAEAKPIGGYTNLTPLNLSKNHHAVNKSTNFSHRGVSELRNRKSSISPSRSAIGLPSLGHNKEQVDLLLKDKCT
jgi:hypothetical protein